MAAIVYLLCALTSAACAVLLWRGYRASRSRLLYWSTFCFAGLALNNMLLLIETQIIPEADLALVRLLPALVGAMALLYGLIVEPE